MLRGVAQSSTRPILKGTMTLHLGSPRGTWTTARGEVPAWMPAPGVYVTQSVGHIDTELAGKIVTGGNDVIRECGFLLAFHDWQKLLTYDGDARKQLTQWGMAVRGQVERVHLLTGSKLVRMGVAVASIALGGMMVAYDDRAVFERVLADAIATKRRPPHVGALLAEPPAHAAHSHRR